MLTCKQVTEVITDYLEGQLSLWDRLRFQMHLGMCSNCRNYLKQMKLTVETLGHLPPIELPNEVSEDLMQQFKDWHKQVPGAKS